MNQTRPKEPELGQDKTDVTTGEGGDEGATRADPFPSGT